MFSFLISLIRDPRKVTYLEVDTAISAANRLARRLGRVILVVTEKIHEQDAYRLMTLESYQELSEKMGRSYVLSHMAGPN